MKHHRHDRNHDHHDDASLEELREALTREFWDERYGGSDRVWSGNPNRRLVEQTADLTPGHALDVGCGEGADAIWLAEQGWQVTAVDVSRVALQRTVQHAIERKVDNRVKVGEYDVLGTHPPHHRRRREGYDLVSAHFMHVPREDFDDVYRKLAAAVATDGRLLVVAHHPHDVDSGVRRPHGPGLLFPPEQLLATLGLEGGSSDDWAIEVAEVQDREQQTDDGPMAVRDTVVRLRRRQ
ncbi:cyclopropane-fatty-acyl-phospholipid synthase family protein [Nocardioides sp. MH1]|uniref:SAM-dependent methyltransferase n=1 Tax=Nocardioides sp. MH1 TaxID=3242490 RepID=UPI0035222672